MAKRVSEIHDPEWKCKYKIGAIIGRLQRCANGELAMTKDQIAAAKIYLSKTVPDLARIEQFNTSDKTIWDKIAEQEWKEPVTGSDV